MDTATTAEPDPPEDVITSAEGLVFPRAGEMIDAPARRALKAGTYEGRESEAVRQILRRDDVVLELGGGIGFISSLLGRLPRTGHVHTYEANTVLARYIREVHAANDVRNATVHNAVLGARKGKATFYVRTPFVASSLDPKDGADVVREETVEVQNVKTVMRKIKPTLLVCDIEGAEQDLIPLMDLSGVRAAVVELHPQWIGPEGVNKVFRAFMDAGLAYTPKRSNQKVVVFKRSWPVR